MKKRVLANGKRMLAGIVVLVMLITHLPNCEVKAQEAMENYPYTLFAGSESEGAITINADWFHLNGSMATNGTIISSGTMNVNGEKIEHVGEEVLDVFNKLEYAYFSGESVDVYEESVSENEMNLNVNTSMKVQGELCLTGNINLNAAVKASGDILLRGGNVNASNCVICSEDGNIRIDASTVSLTGLIYAPKGNVEIIGQPMNLNSVVIIADTITLTSSNINVNYNSTVAEFVGTESEFEPEIYAMGWYNKETHSIDVEWFTNCTNSMCEIMISDDNNEYVSADSVSGTTTYQYMITEDFEERYIKVSLTTYYGETVEAIPFVVRESENGYIVRFLDSDGDDVADLFELEFGTDINKSDSDGDGLPDYQELYLTETDPMVSDSVVAEVMDADADCDGDGLSNAEELELGTSVAVTDSDGDRLSDYEEVKEYNTDPLVADSDNDTLSDWDEVKLGLNPTNSETYGIPDGEYKITQSIAANSSALEKINTEVSPYKLSVDITAAGYVEGNLIAEESGYAKAVQSDAMLGIAFALDYAKSDSIEGVTLSFEIKPEYTENTLNLFPEEEELQGIKRLNVFKYYEEMNMLLPIETQFDLSNNILYTEVNDLGTYCVMDMELWFNGFDVPEEVYVATPALMSLEDDEATEEFTVEESAMSQSDEVAATELEVEGVDVETASEVEREEEVALAEVPMLMSLDATYEVTPIDVAFLLQTSGQLEDTFVSQKQMIVDVMGNLLETYGEENVRICVITYGLSGAKILGGGWIESKGLLQDMLEEVEYQYTTGYTNRGTAMDAVTYRVDFRVSASKYIVHAMNGSTNVSVLHLNQIEMCESLGINYSELMPQGYRYESLTYAEKVKAAIASTNGVYLTYTASATIQLYEHICANVAAPVFEYNVMIPTGWDTITLDGVLDPDNGVDTDDDSLTDWEETDTDKIRWEDDGTIVLPTVHECMYMIEDPLVRLGLARFGYGETLNSSGLSSYIDYCLNSTYVLPILSNPADEDTDGDSLLDGTAIYKTIEVDEESGETESVKVAPKDPMPMKYTGIEGIWQAQIDQYENGIVATEYDESGKGMENEYLQEKADFLVKVLLMFRDEINAYPEEFRSVAMAIKKQLEGSTEWGARFLNFIYDNKEIAYHSQVDTWQREFGYNDMYDELFDIGSNMHNGKVVFSLDETEDRYVLWLWKGDYWNLQSGAEIGLYVLDDWVEGTEQYDVVDFELPMSLSLYNYHSADDIVNIFNWHPNEEQWWVTGFNPEYGDANPELMVSMGKIDFTGKEELFEAIVYSDEEAWRNMAKDQIIFDEDGQILWIMWDYGVFGGE